jgi:hypothetical protein
MSSSPPLSSSVRSHAADNGVCPASSSSSSHLSSLARVSMSTTRSSHTEEGSRNQSQPAYYASWEQETTQSNDIRGDLATGWGLQNHNTTRSNNSTHNIRNNHHHEDSIDVNEDETNNNDQQRQQWGWRIKFNAVRPVPEFYPLDPRSIRRIHLGTTDDDNSSSMEDTTTNSIEEISNRISTACQCLSIHGVWDNTCPSTTLSSMEQVEMVINLHWSEEDGAGEIPPPLSLSFPLSILPGIVVASFVFLFPS